MTAARQVSDYHTPRGMGGGGGGTAALSSLLHTQKIHLKKGGTFANLAGKPWRKGTVERVREGQICELDRVLQAVEGR